MKMVQCNGERGVNEALSGRFRDGLRKMLLPAFSRPIKRLAGYEESFE